MNKIISQMMVSVDGFYKGKDHSLDWHHVDEGHNHYAMDLLDNTSALLFGRKTYQLMAQYWPTPQSQEDSPLVADRMNHLPKIVFSKTLESVNWQETTLVRKQAEEYLNNLKKQSPKNLLILGSGELISYLTNARLIDEYHIIINPIILAEGTHFLKDISEKIPLKLMSTRTFKSGNILLCYQLA